MNSLLDILGATIIGGLIIFLIMNLNIFSSQVKFSSDSDLRLQGNAKTFAEVLDNDLRKVGYRCDSTAIISAQSQKFIFYSDIDNNGSVDKVTLALSDSTKVPQTPNPHDKFLYRIVNGDTSGSPSLGVTNLKFTYYNSVGAATSYPDSIKFIKAEIWLQSPETVEFQGKPEYLKTFWEVTVNPRNI